jgi:hypothetical protein
MIHYIPLWNQSDKIIMLKFDPELAKKIMEGYSHEPKSRNIRGKRRKVPMVSAIGRTLATFFVDVFSGKGHIRNSRRCN